MKAKKKPLEVADQAGRARCRMSRRASGQLKVSRAAEARCRRHEGADVATLVAKLKNRNKVILTHAGDKEHYHSASI